MMRRSIFLSILQAIRAMPGCRCSRPGRLRSSSTISGSRERREQELFHYIIADQIVLPDQNSQFCDEKIVRLPGSFMPRENHVGTMDDAAPNRADHDLRQEWTVFCCSNNAYKINPAVFGSWMKILKSVDQSVVWLSDVGEIAKSNLRKEAKGRSVDPRLMVRPAKSRRTGARRVPG